MCIYLATVAGLFFVIAHLGLRWAFASVILAAAAAAVVAISIWGVDGRHSVLRIARFALAGGVIGPAAVGLVAASKLAGVLVVLMLAGTTPALMSRLRARQLGRGESPAVQPEPSMFDFPAPWGQPALESLAAEPARDLSSLDDGALCLAWRRSFVQLQGARTPVERLSIVDLRQKYLDELHQRSPEGIAAWLASGARASGNPLPYLADHQRRQAG